MSAIRQLQKGEILFREGDPSESMYVIKTGKLLITKIKGSSDIVLAELGPGDMLGEMAFFDGKPRSAGAKAAAECTVIELPFRALNAQFKAFPEWSKAIMRTVNNHLRNANQKIKNLERTTAEETLFFTPEMVTRLAAILAFTIKQFGEEKEGQTVISEEIIRKYTIQVFQLPTSKMEKMYSILQSYGYLKIEELGEGRKQIVSERQADLIRFVEFYNRYLFTSPEKRVTLTATELQTLKTLLFYAKKLVKGGASAEKPLPLNLTEIQSMALQDTGNPFATDDIDSLAQKGLTGEKMSQEGAISTTIQVKEVEKIVPFWDLILAFAKVPKID